MFNIPSDKVLTVNSPKDFMNVTTDFTVVSQSSLATLNKTHDLEKIMEHNKFGIKIIDEVQMWFHNIIKIDGSSNICHNWYLTGTFGRSSEDENNLYHTMFGDLEIFREKEKTPTMFNQRPGNIYGQKPHVHTTMCWTKPKVLTDLTPEEKRKVINSWKYSEKSNQWSRIGINIPLYTEYAIPSNGKMTKYLHNLLELVKQANRQVTYGKMLILVPTIAATETVAKHVREMYPDLLVGTIHSRNKKTDNDYIKQSADILVSTAASAGTGFDCPGLSKMIMAQQLKSWILTEQCFGRLRRRPDGKDCYYWDIVDADQDMKQLVAWANVRADILKRRSKTFHVIDM
jgi:superfamily II DNA or RNA helicase